MASKKKVDLSINDKLKVLEALETSGATIMKVTDQFNISKSYTKKNGEKPTKSGKKSLLPKFSH